MSHRYQLFKSFMIITISLLAVPASCTLGFDGEGDNDPEKVRRVPRLGIVVAEPDAKKLQAELDKLQTLIRRLKQSDPATVKLNLLPDVEVFFRAVDDNFRHQEFFSPHDVKKAFRMLKLGQQRAEQLLAGDAPWLHQTGLVVRGFRSKLDDTVQPYGLVVPSNYRHDSQTGYRVDIWFHGRGETLSETSFLDQRLRNPGYYQPENTIVLHPYGRYSNAFKFAGEVDVLEALAHVQSEYRVDPRRMSVRGFSMGGAACWQFAALHSDRWFAANPGAGFAETPQFLKSFQKETLKPYPWEEKLWRWYDADDHAINFLHVPTIAYSGEDDIQKQAADVMAKALGRYGMRLQHIIGPKTGHRIHIDSQLEIEERMNSIAEKGNDAIPKVVRKITHTLKYNRQYWVTVDRLTQHWEPSLVQAKLRDDGSILVSTSGVDEFSFHFPAGHCPLDGSQPVKVIVNRTPIDCPAPMSDRSWDCSFHRTDNGWQLGKSKPVGLVKKPGLQGPIDDALMSSFLMVHPTGKSMNDQVGKWVSREQKRAVVQWRQHFRGHARVKNDLDITPEDIAKHHLILWGDPQSNQLLKSILKSLPVQWNPNQVTVGTRRFSASSHVPILIYPNPLNPEKYIVINSGFTYREYAYLNNARQVPMLPDWAVVDIQTKPEPNDSIYRFPGIPKAADFFDENWQLKPVQ